MPDNLPEHLRQAAKELTAMPVIGESDADEFHNPTAHIQEWYVGVSFNEAYDEAAEFLSFVSDQTPLKGRILDWGCGWGRMLRVLKRANVQAELHGCDINPELLETCRRAIPGVYLVQCGFFPPSIYRDGSFDVVYAYSVFSHLGHLCHTSWAQEFARILRPGGTVVLTVQPRTFLDYCREFREGVREITIPYQEALAKAFGDESCGPRYDAGEMLYSPAFGPGNDPSAFGEAVVPESFFKEVWGRLGFDLVAWVPHATNLYGQTKVALRKR